MKTATIADCTFQKVDIGWAIGIFNKMCLKKNNAPNKENACKIAIQL